MATKTVGEEVTTSFYDNPENYLTRDDDDSKRSTSPKFSDQTSEGDDSECTVIGVANILPVIWTSEEDVEKLWPTNVRMEKTPTSQTV